MASPWDDVGKASSMLQLMGVDAFGLVSMITQAALTARRNRDMCLQLAEHGRVVAGLLRKLQGAPELRRHPETRRPLEQLDDALRRAYVLVRSCGQEQANRSYLHQLLTGAHAATRLRAAEEEIDCYIRLIPMIGLVAAVRVPGTEEVAEDSPPSQRPCLSLQELPRSITVQGLPPTGDVLLPDVEGFKISGEPKPGFSLRACAFPLNGTTLCNFQWVRYLDNGTRQSIEGATMYDYVVTADDVDTFLAVDCTPMDDNGLQGALVRKFANKREKITCDSDMQNEIDICISTGKPLFNVFILRDSFDEWEPATMMLWRTSYEIKLKHTDEVVIEEKYSPNLQTKIPYGRTTQFVLVSSGGVTLPFNTKGITGPNDQDVRLRDVIVLVIRTFQNKALTLDDEEEGEA